MSSHITSPEFASTIVTGDYILSPFRLPSVGNLPDIDQGDLVLVADAADDGRDTMHFTVKVNGGVRTLTARADALIDVVS